MHVPHGMPVETRVDDHCCAPRRGASLDPASTLAESREATREARHPIEQIVLPGGTFAMGDSNGDGRASDGETFVHPVEVSPFSIDATSVTNAAFATFVAETGYATESERFGFSAVFAPVFAGDESDVLGSPPAAPWWIAARGADWRHPAGRHSSIAGSSDHPVVQVSWNDALAYCRWAGRRLPTEAEWEFASRGGLDRARFPWGNELLPAGEWRCNIWQGSFPRWNSVEDGYVTTAPVRSFVPNPYGLWQTVGNVWEWCADWFAEDWYERSPRQDPVGPEEGRERIIRGGSFLCHDSYCNRYRNSARSSNTSDSATANMGFRTVSV